MNWNPTPEQIDSFGKFLIAAVTAWLAYRDRKCSKDLNIAHAMLRAHESGKPWTEEIRTKQLKRFFMIPLPLVKMIFALLGKRIIRDIVIPELRKAAKDSDTSIDDIAVDAVAQWFEVVAPAEKLDAA